MTLSNTTSAEVNSLVDNISLAVGAAVKNVQIKGEHINAAKKAAKDELNRQLQETAELRKVLDQTIATLNAELTKNKGSKKEMLDKAEAAAKKAYENKLSELEPKAGSQITESAQHLAEFAKKSADAALINTGKVAGKVSGFFGNIKDKLKEGYDKA